MTVSQNLLEIPSIPSNARNALKLSDIIAKVIHRTYSQLQQMADTFSTKSDAERKSQILNFIVSTRFQVVKLIVLTRWAKKWSKAFQIAQDVDAFLLLQDDFITKTADGLFYLDREMKLIREPNYDLVTAVDVLTKGSYTRLPTTVQQRFSTPSLQDSEVTRSKLTDEIMYRLYCQEVIPKKMRRGIHLQAPQGLLRMVVPGEYSCDLTLIPKMSDGLNWKWKLLDLKFLTKFAESDSLDAEGKKSFPSLDFHPSQTARWTLNAQQVMDGELLLSPGNHWPLLALHTFLHQLCLIQSIEGLQSLAGRCITRGPWAGELQVERRITPIDKNPQLSNRRLTVKFWKDPIMIDDGRRFAMDLSFVETRPLSTTQPPPFSPTLFELTAYGPPSLNRDGSKFDFPLEIVEQLVGEGFGDDDQVMKLSCYYIVGEGEGEREVKVELKDDLSEYLDSGSLDFTAVLDKVTSHVSRVLLKELYNVLSQGGIEVKLTDDGILVPFVEGVDLENGLQDGVILLNISKTTGKIQSTASLANGTSSSLLQKFATLENVMNSNWKDAPLAVLQLRHQHLLDGLEKFAVFVGWKALKRIGLTEETLKELLMENASEPLYLQFPNTPSWYIVMSIVGNTSQLEVLLIRTTQSPLADSLDVVDKVVLETPGLNMTVSDLKQLWGQCRRRIAQEILTKPLPNPLMDNVQGSWSHSSVLQDLNVVKIPVEMEGVLLKMAVTPRELMSKIPWEPCRKFQAVNGLLITVSPISTLVRNYPWITFNPSSDLGVLVQAECRRTMVPEVKLSTVESHGQLPQVQLHTQGQMIFMCYEFVDENVLTHAVASLQSMAVLGYFAGQVLKYLDGYKMTWDLDKLKLESEGLIWNLVWNPTLKRLHIDLPDTSTLIQKQVVEPLEEEVNRTWNLCSRLDPCKVIMRLTMMVDKMFSSSSFSHQFLEMGHVLIDAEVRGKKYSVELKVETRHLCLLLDRGQFTLVRGDPVETLPFFGHYCHGLLTNPTSTGVGVGIVFDVRMLPKALSWLRGCIEALQFVEHVLDVDLGSLVKGGKGIELDKDVSFCKSNLRVGWKTSLSIDNMQAGWWFVKIDFDVAKHCWHVQIKPQGETVLPGLDKRETEQRLDHLSGYLGDKLRDIHREGKSMKKVVSAMCSIASLAAIAPQGISDLIEFSEMELAGGPVNYKLHLIVGEGLDYLQFDSPAILGDPLVSRMFLLVEYEMGENKTLVPWIYNYLVKILIPRLPNGHPDYAFELVSTAQTMDQRRELLPKPPKFNNSLVKTALFLSLKDGVVWSCAKLVQGVALQMMKRDGGAFWNWLDVGGSVSPA